MALRRDGTLAGALTAEPERSPYALNYIRRWVGAGRGPAPEIYKGRWRPLRGRSKCDGEGYEEEQAHRHGKSPLLYKYLRRMLARIPGATQSNFS